MLLYPINIGQSCVQSVLIVYILTTNDVTFYLELFASANGL